MRCQCPKPNVNNNTQSEYFRCESRTVTYIHTSPVCIPGLSGHAAAKLLPRRNSLCTLPLAASLNCVALSSELRLWRSFEFACTFASGIKDLVIRSEFRGTFGFESAGRVQVWPIAPLATILFNIAPCGRSCICDPMIQRCTSFPSFRHIDIRESR